MKENIPSWNILQNGFYRMDLHQWKRVPASPEREEEKDFKVASSGTYVVIEIPTFFKKTKLAFK